MSESPMPVDAATYDGAASGWATGAALVYGPLARALVARAPHPLAGRVVLDVGAGTGAGSDALRAVGAVPLALDLSWEMLAWHRRDRPPAVVGDVHAVPVRPRATDDVVAPFVLNHVGDPAATIRELARSVRPGGAFLATTFSSATRSVARDTIDEVARAHGWRVPPWYREVKTSVMPLLGSRHAMAAVAADAGLEVVAIEERAVDVGVHRAADLVRYRFGQAQFVELLRSLAAPDEAALRAAAVEAVEPVMEPYRPVVVFLSALVG